MSHGWKGRGALCVSAALAFALLYWLAALHTTLPNSAELRTLYSQRVMNRFGEETEQGPGFMVMLAGGATGTFVFGQFELSMESHRRRKKRRP